MKTVPTLLQLNSSLYGDRGESSKLADRYVSEWRAQHNGSRILYRDLAGEPVPHLTAERFQAFLSKPEERTAAQKAVVDASDALIDELKRADVIVIGAPMYNFNIPSTLKSYFDHIARAGVTFRYTEKGPVGLLTGKKAYVFSTRGGIHAGGPTDHETGYVRAFLGFLGITDVEFVYAEGLAYGEEPRKAAIAKAHEAIARLSTPDVAYAA
jgi:FMN-dependent NADH-azoreductase